MTIIELEEKAIQTVTKILKKADFSEVVKQKYHLEYKNIKIILNDKIEGKEVFLEKVFGKRPYDTYSVKLMLSKKFEKVIEKFVSDYNDYVKIEENKIKEANLIDWLKTNKVDDLSDYF